MKKLSKNLNGKYQLKTIRPGKHDFPDWGVIDLTTITLEKADRIFSEGFPFLVKIENSDVEATETPLETPLETPAETDLPLDPKLRLNKKYINTLLALNWSDMKRSDHFLFFYSQSYFLGKKQRMIQNGDLDQKMKSAHAKLRTMTELTDSDRKPIIGQIDIDDQTRAENWLFIDTWNENDVDVFEQESVTTAPNMVKMALDLVNQIDVDKVWIYRNEKIIPNMKVDTPAKKKKKADRRKELAMRKQRVIDNEAKIKSMTE